MDETTLVERLRPCPECAAGKHDNCSGQTWSIVLNDYAPCPCHERGH